MEATKPQTCVHAEFWVQCGVSRGCGRKQQRPAAPAEGSSLNSTFTSWTLPPRCMQAIRKLCLKRGESTLWVLSTCVGEEDYRCQCHSYLPQRKGISQEPLCSCQLRMRQVGAALDNLSRAIQEESRRVDLRAQKSLRMTNGPTTFTTVQ